jgi:hypothetical protein
LQQQQFSHLPEVPPRLPGPIQPTHIILHVVREWQGDPPHSHELYTAVNRDYAGVFPSRRQGRCGHFVRVSVCCMQVDFVCTKLVSLKAGARMGVDRV